MCVVLFCVRIVCFVVLMSLSGLHYIIDNWVYGVGVGGGMNLGPLFCKMLYGYVLICCSGSVVVLYNILLVGLSCV